MIKKFPIFNFQFSKKIRKRQEIFKVHVFLGHKKPASWRGQDTLKSTNLQVSVMMI